MYPKCRPTNTFNIVFSGVFTFLYIRDGKNTLPKPTTIPAFGGLAQPPPSLLQEICSLSHRQGPCAQVCARVAFVPHTSHPHPSG